MTNNVLFKVEICKGGMKMKKFLMFGVLLFLAVSLFSVSAQGGNAGSGQQQGAGQGLIASNENGGWAGQGLALGLNKYRNENGDDMDVEMNGGIKLRVRNMTAHSDLNITPEMDQNRTRLRVHFSNGNNALVKVMPGTASERALERLRLKVCNESNNCTIQLKETGKGNESKASYEVQVERHFKILGMFKTKAQVRAEVDSESGNVTAVGKPWWSFLASEPAE